MKYRIEIESPEESGVFSVSYFVTGQKVSEKDLKEYDAWYIFCILDTATEVLRKHRRFPKV